MREHPRDADAIVCSRSDDSSHVRSMSRFVHRVVVPDQIIPGPRQCGCVREVPSPNVVHVSIGIVVDTRNAIPLRRVDPDVLGQIRVRVLYP